jgi:hypothetical protein
MLNSGAWKGQRSLTPEQALELNDCAKCETHKTARREIRNAKKEPTAPKQKLTGPDQTKGRSRSGGGSKRLKVGRESYAHGVTVPDADAEIIASADDKGQRLALEHAALAREHGWDASVTNPNPTEWVVVAKKGDESVQAAWVGGKVDYPRIVAFFPTHQFWLKNTTQWRRQVSLSDSERPASREPKGRPPKVPAPKRIMALDSGEPAGAAIASVPEEDGVKFSMTSLPFGRDETDTVIIDALKGRKLYWRNNFAGKVNSAEVPSSARSIRISEHPTNGRRIVSFPEVADSSKGGEVLGCERSVAIDQMIKVR